MTGSLRSTNETGSDLFKKQCQFSYEGPWAISLSDDQPLLWNAETGEDIAILSGHRSRVNAIAFSPNGKRVITATNDSELSIWDTANGKNLISMLYKVNSFSSCAFSPDERRILCGLTDGTLHFLDSDTLQILNSVQVSTHAILTCAFSPDGRSIASGSEDGILELRSADSGSLIFTLRGHDGGITTCAFSLNGEKIITGSKDSTLKIWDTTIGACEHTLNGHTTGITCVCFSADNQKAVSCSDDTTIRIWDVFSGKSLITVYSGSETINACAFYPDGKTICTGLSDNSIKTWDVASGKNRSVFRRNAEKKTRDTATSQLILLNKEITTLINQGLYSDAITQAKKTQDFANASFGNRSQEYATTIINLALLYRMKKENQLQSESLFKEALKIREGIFGPDHPETGEVYFFLGTVILAMDNVPEARRILNKAISIRKHVKEGWNEDIAKELDILITAIDEQKKRIPIKKYHEGGAGLPHG